MKTAKIKIIVKNLLSYLEGLPLGSEISTYEAIWAVYGKGLCPAGTAAIDNEQYASQDLMAVDLALSKSARRKGLILDKSAYDGCAVGLPYAIPFVLRRG